jgi:hypothetical protein
MIRATRATLPAFGNWLTGTANPYGLLAPPQSFLRELAVFDPDAVIVPSAQHFGYWLTRKRRRTAGIMTVAKLGKDSQTFANHDLIPVTMWGGSITWGAAVFQWLRDHDTWAAGGADAASKLLEAQDEAAEKAQRRTLRDENIARARSMYRTYKRRSGESVALSDLGRGRGGSGRSKRTVTVPPRTNTGQGAQTPTPAGWSSSASGSGIITPPSLR